MSYNTAAKELNVKVDELLHTYDMADILDAMAVNIYQFGEHELSNYLHENVQQNKIIDVKNEQQLEDCLKNESFYFELYENPARWLHALANKCRVLNIDYVNENDDTLSN